MNVHEYQAKEILSQYGIPVPQGRSATSPEEVEEIARAFGMDVVLKAQIHAGGRGKAGGIRLASNPEDARQIAEEMLGMRLVTHQTGPGGKEVHRVLVEETVDIDRELYLGIVLDRANARVALLASQAGGMDIEEISAQMPERIRREEVDPSVGFLAFQARRLAFGLGLTGPLVRAGAALTENLYRLYVESDCSLAEINPLAVTADGTLLALDAKLNFDDNALHRHPDLAQLRDPEEEDPLEVAAAEHHLNYIRLDGTVGCMVNGAGLAMATMDLIKLAGGQPANFLDVGGAARSETVENGFRILLSDPNVKAVLINIFGGIVRCDRVAEGVVRAVSELDIRVPVVVRLRGTNADEGMHILQASGLAFIVAEDLADAAQRAVQAAS